jgi:hypothetical protein
MQCGDASQVKDYLPLVGVVLGGILSIAGGYVRTLLVENRRARRESRNLAYAFKGELTALRKIVEERKYLEGLKKAVDSRRSGGQPFHLIVNVRREYFNVYAKNVDGTLNTPLPEWIATFYTQANSVLEDLETFRDGALADAPTADLIEAYKELHRLFTTTISLAQTVCDEIDRQHP